ncbi:MAG: phosphatase PAP2 family protein [Thermoguttaceae bacterium]|nr:phosphatase PAP2 family protein [Thermoguttaceae bacterium]MDW8079832.1 phosphatase PAP2 family protein [Thermoguttaceae bacterium]
MESFSGYKTTIRGPSPARVGSLVFAGVGFLVASILALWVDHPLGAWCVADRVPDFVEEICNAAEPFGDGLTVILLLLVLARLVPPARPYLPRVAAISLGSGVLVNVIKQLVPRYRPRHFDFALTIWESFGATVAPDGRSSTIESFPSGHTATAIGLAIGLSWLWPEGRVIFWGLALLVGLQRVETGAHFLSDVLAAAGLSCFVGVALLSERLLGWPFSRLEAHLISRGACVGVELEAIHTEADRPAVPSRSDPVASSGVIDKSASA